MNVTPSQLIAVIDIGKSNSRLSLIDADSGIEVWHARRVNLEVQNANGIELDIFAIENWLLESLRNAPHKECIRAIVPVAHGAAAVLIDSNGEVLMAPDYEDTCYEVVNAQYDSIRDDYAHTFSPNLPLGLNLGRQWFYLQQYRPALFNLTAYFLLYPQYWAWRLSGVLSSEVTSLGCHTDLWRPTQATYSSLVQRQQWATLIPPLRQAMDVLGAITPAVSAHTGLNPKCAVVCGIHDSNASYLRFLPGREHESFTVVSSGTWTVVMANRSDLLRLQEQRDMLTNVNVFGMPVATARYMGGREYEMIAPESHAVAPETSIDILNTLLNDDTMAFPCFASAGPYAARKSYFIHADNLSAAAQATLATIYSALMTDVLIESLDASGEIIVDGPFAQNILFGPLLAACNPAYGVRLYQGSGGTQSAAWLARQHLQTKPLPHATVLHDVKPLQLSGFSRYRAEWRRRLQVVT